MIYLELGFEQIDRIDNTQVLKLAYQQQRSSFGKQICQFSLKPRTSNTYILSIVCARLDEYLLVVTGEHSCMPRLALLPRGDEQLMVESENHNFLREAASRDQVCRGGRATGQKDTANRTALLQLMFVWRETIAPAFSTHRQVAGTYQGCDLHITFSGVSQFFPTRHSAPVLTGMLTKAACYSICIFCCVPYLLTSLHITISTAIRAVDDNQSAN